MRFECINLFLYKNKNTGCQITTAHQFDVLVHVALMHLLSCDRQCFCGIWLVLEDSVWMLYTYSTLVVIVSCFLASINTSPLLSVSPNIFCNQIITQYHFDVCHSNVQRYLNFTICDMMILLYWFTHSIDGILTDFRRPSRNSPWSDGRPRLQCVCQSFFGACAFLLTTTRGKVRTQTTCCIPTISKG